MLNQYLQQTQQLISDAKSELLTPVFLTSFINTARRQLAGEGECIRNFGTMDTVVNQGFYTFSSLFFGAASDVTGVQGAIHIRSIRYQIASGSLWIPPRAWEWFELYELNNATPVAGQPKTWSQIRQGAASGSGGGGSFAISPVPDAVYTLTCDCVCFPIALIDDATTEAIPFLWTDAVPYFAAYLAYLYVQNAGAASNMMEMYTMFVKRARAAATPEPGGWQYAQASDPAQLSKFAKPGAA